jgi:YHS domain-containing protein
MVLAMLAGMVVLGAMLAALGDPPGYRTLVGMYAYMAVAMSAPMVAWMRRMGHPWADCWEMTAWMVVPMFALVAPVALGLEGYVPGLTAHSLMLYAHVAMIGGMAALMLYRWDRYALGTHCHAAPVAAAAPAADQASGSVAGGNQPAPSADPVCGMPVDLATARHTAQHGGRSYAFCAPGCRKAFQRDPARFLAAGYVPSM